MHQCSDAGRDKITQLLVYLLLHHSVLLGLPLQVSLSYFIRYSVFYLYIYMLPTETRQSSPTREPTASQVCTVTSNVYEYVLWPKLPS